MPGLASPMAFSIPTSVSAIRTGALPARGSGVTVFVTYASSVAATSGATSASRQPLALSSRKDRPFHAEPLELPPELDHAAVRRGLAAGLAHPAVAGAIAAGHRPLPRELGVRTEPPNGREHRLGPAGEHVVAVRHRLGHVDGLEHDLGVRDERCRLGVPARAE